ncbi:hypothetical protein ACJ73_08358, partial [Blastomyces percursus]
GPTAKTFWKKASVDFVHLGVFDRLNVSPQCVEALPHPMGVSWGPLNFLGVYVNGKRLFRLTHSKDRAATNNRGYHVSPRAGCTQYALFHPLFWSIGGLPSLPDLWHIVCTGATSSGSISAC